MPSRARIFVISLIPSFFAIMALLSTVSMTAAEVAQQPAATSTAEIRILPDKVDLRPVFQAAHLTSRSQQGRPTCSVFAVTGALEFATAKRQDLGPRLSPEFLNWAANKVGGDNQDGGFFSDLWRGFTNYGICAEEHMPYQAKFDPTRLPGTATLDGAKSRLLLGLQWHWIKEWNVKTGLSPEEFQDCKRTLALGWPVCGGFRWPKQEQWTNDILQICPASKVFDGHSLLLVGYRDDAGQPGGGVFIFRNSGGSGRDGFMPYAYAQEFMNDAAWIDLESRLGLAK